MLPGDREPSVYEISKRDYKESVDYWVKKTGNSYVFQKALLSEDHVLLRYQLISYESLGNLNHFLPETLTDNNHRFWLSVEEPQELIIEEKSTNKEVCRVKNFNTEKSYIESSIYKIWTQKQVANSLLGKRFSCFENTAFIEIRELQMAPYHDDLVRNKPLYIITLPRYQLTFHVANINPLVINSVNPLGKLLLSETFHNLTNIKNALFLEKESGGNVALLPRQYFISDTSLSHDKFEYMPVVLDVENKHQDLVLNKKNSEKVYKKQSEFLEFTMSDDGKIAAKNSADALYLAYVYLANFDPEASLRVLQECEKSGGIKLTQREMEHLMLMFTSLPAVSESNENVSQKMINTPEFIAVKAYALYLYASAQYKKTSFEFEEPLGSDGECFCNEAKNFKKNLQKYIDTFLIKYQSVKNDIPVDMQLTAQQELECLDLSDAPLLVLVKKRLLVENLQKEDLTVLNPNQKEEVQASKNRLLEDKLSESQSQYRTQQYSVGATASKDETTLVNLINLPRIKYISGKTPKDCIEKYSSKEKVKIAMEQLSLNLELENFFKSFLTYYYIVTSTEPPLTEEKNALKEFLTCKLKILGNNHPLYGKELIIILYKILDNPNEVINLKKMEIFLKEVHGESLGYNLRKVIDGYYFDSYEFYNYLMGFFKDLTVTIEVEGVKREENSLEPMKLQETFSKNESVLSKPLVYDPPKLLFYSGKGNILKKYKLKSMEDVEMESISIEFLKKYREILSNGETNFLNAKERFKKEKVEFFNFEKFSFQELIFEKELGDVQNKTSQNQVALAKQYFSIEENQKKVYGKVKACLNEAKQAKAKLLDLIKKTVNHGPILNELNRLHQLALQGKLVKEINERMLLNLYLLGDEKSFTDATGLAAEQVAKVYKRMTEYLFIATYCQQLEGVRKELTKLKDVDDKDKPFACANIAYLLAAKNCVDPAKDPAALSVFQFCGEVLLRPEQVSYLRSHVEMTDNRFKDLMSQLIMGFGKTFLLPIIAKAKATGNNLSVIEVPDPLFETNVNDLHNASMRFLNQKTKSLKFNRKTSCSATDLEALYEWLISIKQNRDYLVTTGESVASINLRYVEILTSISSQQQLLADMPEALGVLISDN